jgi:peptidoglycan/xylan/chitin deacetylase (PgdA/CDA1 family)
MRTFNKRQRLAAWLNRCGLFRLLELGRRPGLLVLAYHRIGSPAGHLLDDGVMSATPEDFEVQVDYLCRRCDLPPLETVLPTLEAGLPLSRPTVLITFDDGYRDNVDCALPILRKAGVGAVFFICPRFVTSPVLPFWDRLAYVFKKATRSFALEYPFPYRVDLENVSPPAAVQHYLNELDHWPPGFDEQRLFGHLEEKAGVAAPVEALARDLFTDWAGVRRLAGAGMSIGSHCQTHPFLPRLSEDEQRHELTRSKAELERQLGQPITTVSYPYGKHNDLTRRLAREAGYRLGFSYGDGRHYRTLPDLFAINRLSIDADVVWPQFRARLACSQALGRRVF